MNTLIVSDLHLGSRNCEARNLLRALETKFDRLILNGDTVNNLNFKKLKPDHWAVVSRLRDIGRKRELILIRGNHDGTSTTVKGFGPGDVLATLLGVPLTEEFQLDVGGRPYLVLHGDRFDPTLNWPSLTDAADWGYQTVQKLNKKAAKWLKRRVKKLGGVVQLVKQQSICYAKSRGCAGIVAGHTHFCDDEWIDGIHYLNTGCWVDRPCNFVVAEREQIRLGCWEVGCLPVEEDKDAA